MALPLADILNTQNFFAIVKPLIFFIIGLTIYSLFVFNFYKFVAKKKIFKFKTEKYRREEHPALNKFFGFIFYIIENIIVMPLLIFFWFIIFTAMMAFLSKNDIETLLLISAALVGTIRITAHYNESLSKDLAKLIPFALLGIFLVDISYFSLESSLSTIWGMTTHWLAIVHYLIFIVILEFLIDIGFAILAWMGIVFEENLEE